MRLARSLHMAAAYGSSLAAWTAHANPRPFSASFAVTNRCNLRCRYCNFPLLEHDELDLPDVARLFDRLRRLGIVRLGLVGGEPLVRKDIGAIVDLARERDFYLSLNSNLTLYERFRSVFDGIDLIFTSLDATPEAHRANRGADALDGVLEAIADLRRRGKQVVPICVVNEQTVEHAPALLDLAAQLDVSVHFQPQCVDTAIVRGSLSRELSNGRLRRFFADLIEAKDAGRPVQSSREYLRYLAHWPDFFVSAVADPAARCAAGRGFLFVDPRGDAYPCAYTKGKAPAVNLLDTEWSDRFSGETPCTRCSVGPMLEFNLLFQSPVRSVVDAVRSYL
jgi:MoaA/NifB/PqqE/SkfB family radical SAM enzyme